MDWPPESLVAAAECAIPQDHIPTELIRSYLTLSKVSQPDREKHARYLSAFLLRRSSVSTLASDVASTVWSSDQSSKRNTQYSLASTNTTYSSFSNRSRPSLQHTIPDVPICMPLSSNRTPTIRQERVDYPTSSTRARSRARDISVRTPTSTSKNDAAKNKTIQPSNPKPYSCPWCDIPCGRASDLKVHIKDHCGSKTVWICQRCGNTAHSRVRAQEHRKEDNDGECRYFDFIERELDYDRRAYACRHYSGKLFGSLVVYMDHLAQNCRLGKVSGLGDRSLQIRNLLYQPYLLDTVEALCLRKWGTASALASLSWNLPDKEMTERVQRLEYGVRDLEDGELNCGIASEDIDAFLMDLIDKSVRNVNGKIVDLGRLDKPLPEPPEIVTEQVPDWQEDVLLSLPSADFTESVAQCTAQSNGALGHSLELASSGLTHRQKRPISDNSAQHPESQARLGINPFFQDFTSTAANKAHAELAPQVDLDWFQWGPLENHLCPDDTTPIPPIVFDNNANVLSAPVPDLQPANTGRYGRYFNPADDVFLAMNELADLDCLPNISSPDYAED